eukprot:PhF_6_TR11722/c0_g1_i2/m.19121
MKIASHLYFTLQAVLFFLEPIHSNYLVSTSTYTTPVTDIFKDIPFNPKTFYLPIYQFKGYSGITVRLLVNNDTSLSDKNDAVAICVNIFNSSRFHILGNMTTTLSFRAVSNVSVHELQDMIAILRNITLVWKQGPHFNLTRHIYVFEWYIERDGCMWCPQCFRYIKTEWGDMNYMDITVGESTLWSPAGVIKGVYIRNERENNFLRDNNFWGMTCGKFSVENNQWEWGCQAERNAVAPATYVN